MNKRLASALAVGFGILSIAAPPSDQPLAQEGVRPPPIDESDAAVPFDVEVSPQEIGRLRIAIGDLGGIVLDDRDTASCLRSLKSMAGEVEMWMLRSYSPVTLCVLSEGGIMKRIRIYDGITILKDIEVRSRVRIGEYSIRSPADWDGSAVIHRVLEVSSGAERVLLFADSVEYKALTDSGDGGGGIGPRRQSLFTTSVSFLDLGYGK